MLPPAIELVKLQLHGLASVSYADHATGFHQLDRRWEHLRVRKPHRQRQLLASLGENGQQTPIVVVIAKNDSARYLVIDGYKRIAALEPLRGDTVEATVWPMCESEDLLLSRSLRLSPQESALEQGWLLSEMEQRFGYSLAELARRFDRSVSWVSKATGRGWSSCCRNRSSGKCAMGILPRRSR